MGPLRREAEVYHIGWLKAQTFSWPGVQAVLNQGDLVRCDLGKRHFLRKVLPDRAVSVFVESTFPRTAGMGEIDVGVSTCAATQQLAIKSIMNKQYHSDDWQESERESAMLTCVEASQSHVSNLYEMTDILTSQIKSRHTAKVSFRQAGAPRHSLKESRGDLSSFNNHPPQRLRAPARSTFGIKPCNQSRTPSPIP